MENYSKKAVFDILAVAGSIVTISVALIPDKIATLINDYQIMTISIFLVLNTLIYLFITREKCEIDLKVNETTNINISYGDLFKKDGINIIPVNDFFDTIVDDDIISKNTLHGMFINKYFDTDEKIGDLKKQIDSSLSNEEYILKKERGKGNKKKYPLGTSAIVEVDKKKFFLVVVSEFNLKTNRAVLKTSDYPLVISRMMEFIHNKSQGYNVNIPLIGGAHLGIDLPKEKLVEMIVFSAYTAEKLAVIKGINIILHDSIRKEINLNRIYHTFNTY